MKRWRCFFNKLKDCYKDLLRRQGAGFGFLIYNYQKLRNSREILRRNYGLGKKIEK